MYKDPKAQKEYQQSWYERNKSQHKQRSREQKEKKEAMLRELKRQPCMDCGKSYTTCVMEFDHRDPSTKVEGVSTLLRSASMKRVLEEIEKCDLVCANCHKMRGHVRGSHQRCY